MARLRRATFQTYHSVLYFRTPKLKIIEYLVNMLILGRYLLKMGNSPLTYHSD
jgi:hypothetical protein